MLSVNFEDLDNIAKFDFPTYLTFLNLLT